MLFIVMTATLLSSLLSVSGGSCSSRRPPVPLRDIPDVNCDRWLMTSIRGQYRFSRWYPLPAHRRLPGSTTDVTYRECFGLCESHDGCVAVRYVPSRSVSIPVPIDINDVNEDTARDNHDYSTAAECDLYSDAPAQWSLPFESANDFKFGDEKFFTVNRTCSTPDHPEGVAVSRIIGSWIPTCSAWTELKAQPLPSLLHTMTNMKVKNVYQCSQQCLDHDSCNAFYYHAAADESGASSSASRMVHQCYLFDAVTPATGWRWIPMDQTPTATSSGIAQVIDRTCARDGTLTPVDHTPQQMPFSDEL